MLKLIDYICSLLPFWYVDGASKSIAKLTKFSDTGVALIYCHSTATLYYYIL